VYGSTTRRNVFKLDKGRVRYALRKYYVTNRVVNALNSLPGHMLYYLKLLTLLNCDLINFGNIKIYHHFICSVKCKNTVKKRVYWTRRTRLSLIRALTEAFTWAYVHTVWAIIYNRMRFLSHNWSATKQRLHPQSVAEITRHSVLSGDRIQQ